MAMKFDLSRLQKNLAEMKQAGLKKTAPMLSRSLAINNFCCGISMCSFQMLQYGRQQAGAKPIGRRRHAAPLYTQRQRSWHEVEMKTFRFFVVIRGIPSRSVCMQPRDPPLP